MKAMIFAAGFGKRLDPITRHTPKPLVQVQNRAIIDWIIEQLEHYGIDDIIINLHYLPHAIENHLKSTRQPVTITFSRESELLGTGAGLCQTIPFWDSSDFYLCNSDILCTADLSEFFAFHKKSGSMATLAINTTVSDSMLLIDGQGTLVGIRKRGENKVHRNPDGQIHAVGFCGLHVISPAIFACFRNPAAFSIIDEYLNLVARGVKISTWSIGDAYWIDIGTEAGLENANRHFPGFSYASS